MKRQVLWVSMLSAGLLAACGGGGGDATSGQQPAATASVSGVAAKGLMANANVTAHAVRDGSIDPTPLSSTSTDNEGNYTLTFPATVSQPYIIKITAKSDGTTTHLDEVTGVPQPLPANFTMRSVFVPTSTGTAQVSMNVTPFSEMAVEAAENASGGVTVANAQQAVSTVKQLLGFDPTTVAVKSTTTAGTAEEQAMAAMLTAVSQMASTSALGCDTGSAGDKTKCVVEQLAAATSTTTTKLQTGSLDVSSALASAVTTVLSTPSLSGSVSAAALNTVQTNLACEGDACTAVSPTVLSSIEAAKSLFTELKSDWTSMFSPGSAVNPAAVNLEANKFQAAMEGVQAPAELLIKDAGALLMGIDLYNDFKAGRTSSNARGRAPGELSTGFGVAPDYNAVGCTLYQDQAATSPATAPANANFIVCRASYYASQVGAVFNEWIHGFTLSPTTTDGSFDYTAKARLRAGSQRTDLSDVYSGTIKTSRNTTGNIVAFEIAGDLPGAFEMGGNTLVNHHQSWTLNGTRTINGPGDSSSTVSGSVTAKDAGGATLGTLQVKSGSFAEIPVSRTADGFIVAPQHPQAVSSAGSELATAALNVVWTTPQAEFEGSFSATESTWDKSLTTHAPTKLALSGALRTIEGASTTEFLSGRLDVALKDAAIYDDTAPASASNFVTVDAKFVGKVTAPNRPLLELTMGTSHKSHETEPALVTMQYRSVVNGSPKRVIDLSVSRNASGVATLTLTEAASSLSLTVADGATSANLLSGSTVVGTATRSTGLLTFADGSFISLDMGL